MSEREKMSVPDDQTKLVALLEGLEVRHIDCILAEGTADNLRRIGEEITRGCKTYANLVKDYEDTLKDRPGIVIHSHKEGEKEPPSMFESVPMKCPTCGGVHPCDIQKACNRHAGICPDCGRYTVLNRVNPIVEEEEDDSFELVDMKCISCGKIKRREVQKDCDTRITFCLACTNATTHERVNPKKINTDTTESKL